MGISDTIKHFEGLQKRYTRQHNGTACEHVKLALEGLRRMAERPEVVHAYWSDVKYSQHVTGHHCSACRYVNFSSGNYCGNCGARMDADAPERGKDGRDG